MGENLRLGQRVSMLCSVTDGDLPISLTWFRDEAKMISSSSSADGVDISQIGSYESVLRAAQMPVSRSRVSCLTNPDLDRNCKINMYVFAFWARSFDIHFGCLRIDHLRPGHNANFTCVAENPAGSAAHSQTLRVKGTSDCRYYGERT